MRTLSSPLTTALAGPVTTPGYLVEILFSTPLHLSSRGALDALGSTWLGWQLIVKGLGIDASRASQAGSLILGNSDNTIGALVLNQGIGDRAINIWAFSSEAPGDADIVQVFAGVGDGCEFDPDGGALTISLAQAGGQTQFTPRRYITTEQGFSFLPPRDSLISWNGEQYRLQGDA